MLNPVRDKKKRGTYRGGEEGRHLCPRLVRQKLVEGKTSYELGWKAEVMIKK